MDLYPSRTVLRRLDEHGETWPEVLQDLEHPEVVTPVVGSDTRQRVTGHDYVAYAEPIEVQGEEALLIVGVRPRERPSPGLAYGVVGVEPQAVRSSRRGGSGRRWPSSWSELLERLRAIPGVTAERGRTHIIVKKDGKTVDTVPATASEYRGLLNACTQLRHKGLDVSRQTYRGGWSLTVLALASIDPSLLTDELALRF